MRPTEAEIELLGYLESLITLDNNHVVNLFKFVGYSLQERWETVQCFCATNICYQRMDFKLFENYLETLPIFLFITEGCFCFSQKRKTVEIART